MVGFTLWRGGEEDEREDEREEEEEEEEKKKKKKRKRRREEKEDIGFNLKNVILDQIHSPSTWFSRFYLVENIPKMQEQIW